MRFSSPRGAYNNPPAFAFISQLDNGSRIGRTPRLVSVVSPTHQSKPAKRNPVPMAMTSSFLSQSRGRPPRYRTPSPPRRAVEPISPVCHPDTRISWNERSSFQPSHTSRDSYSELNDRSRGSDVMIQHQAATTGGTPSSPKAMGYSHHRSSSNIETLANIALATSPTFAPRQHESYQGFGPMGTSRWSYPDDHYLERPTKRMRSDRVSSPQAVSGGYQTPSHDSVSDSMKTDAELLLNFARPSNFIPRPSTTATHPPLESKWPTTAAPIPQEQQPPVHFAGNGISPSRHRSHSDGAMALERPPVPELRPNTSSSTLAPNSWNVEPKTEEAQPLAASSNGNDNPQEATPHQSASSAPQDAASEERKEESDSYDSSQGTCAECNMSRADGAEDQTEDTWIGCDGCKRWFHIICAGFKNDREVRTVDRFICRECRPIHGQTTFVRKSSRARTAIDYAGLNQGLVKTATDSYEHHYIQFIKEGKVQCLPENFPRMRPELVTAEFFERGMGMTEPIIIPAELNPRSSVRAPAPEAEYDNLVSEAATQEMFDELLEHLPDTGEPEVVIDCGQDALDMVVPQGLTVRTVAELYGPDERVEVIDVKSQQGEDKRWNMRKWADYYESSGPKVVRNVISLEVSQSPLGKLIRRPKVVRDLDLQDAVWPEELRAVGEWPKVQFYCLMSVADCYTDFHIDFGGSSVYYTILKGKKTFFFIPPRDKHLKKYEEWCNSPSQDTTFLADQTKECYRVDLQEGDTMLIPAGWIHAVWTPENSLVIGGNFLTRLNYGMQIKVAKIEKDTRVPRKFRYPYFQKIQWFAALKYLEEDPIPDSVLEAFARDENYRFYREYPIYYEFGERANTAPRGDPYYNARFYSQAELEGLPELTKYLLRTALIAAGHSVDGVTLETRNAVKRSIPKMSGDPLEVVKKFAVWVAWKRGNERAPSWTRPGAITPNFKVDQSEKRPAGRPSRRSEKHFDSQRMYSERQSVRRLSDSTSERPSISRTVSAPSDQSTPAPAVGGNPSPVIKEETPKPRTVNRGPGLGPKRVACDACRKRRIRCRHKDEADETSDSQALAQDAASVLNALASAATESSGQSLGITSGQMDGAVVNGVNGGKKGRTKACEECRKSKVCASLRPYM